MFSFPLYVLCSFLILLQVRISGTVLGKRVKRMYCLEPDFIGKCDSFLSLSMTGRFLIDYHYHGESSSLLLLLLLLSCCARSNSCNTMDCSTPGIPVPHRLPRVCPSSSMALVMPSSHLTLHQWSHVPLSILPSLKSSSHSQWEHHALSVYGDL